MTPLFAAIDLGSHSIKLTLARRDSAGVWTVVLDTVRITGLGRGVPARDGLLAEGRRRSLDALAEFVAIGRDHGVAATAAVGTAVLRHAPDTPSFLAQVRDTLDLEVRVIDGDEEATLTYLGAVASLPRPTDPGVDLACDIGGHSTELAWGDGTELVGRRSLEVGTISLGLEHGLESIATRAPVAAARDDLRRRLADLPPIAPVRRLILIGATPGSLLALDRGEAIADGGEVHGQSLAPAVVNHQIDRLRRLTTAERARLAGLHPQRAPVILAGAVIAAAIQERWSGTPALVSAAGLREGLLEACFGSPSPPNRS